MSAAELAAERDAARAELAASKAREAELMLAIEENTFHDMDAYIDRCLPGCWRCELLAARTTDREAGGDE